MKNNPSFTIWARVKTNGLVNENPKLNQMVYVPYSNHSYSN